MITEFSIILSDTTRSAAYLISLYNEKIYPKEIILLNKNKQFYLKKTILSKFENVSCIKKFKCNWINQNIKNYIYKKKIKNLVFSGTPGYIIKDSRFLKKIDLIHCHPGKLPQFKGSTTIYYSLLKNKKINCSSIILNNKLDSGKILLIKRFKLPRNIQTIDKDYDDLIRSKTLISTLKNLKKLKAKKINNRVDDPYFVIHPVLRSIVFKKFS